MTQTRTVRGNYIQGQFVKVGDPNGEVLSINPGNLEAPALHFPFSFEHIQEAVSAARQAFTPWKRMAATERLNAVKKYSELMKHRLEELAICISTETGKPLWEAREEVTETLSLIGYYLATGSQSSQTIEIPEATAQSRGMVRFFPRGVMVVVCPPYLPIREAHAQFIPALINGNTLVIKSSPTAPLTGQLMAELVHDSGLPSGTVNVMHGDEEVARRLVSTADIDGIFFSGSNESTSKIQKVLADYWKVVVVEMRGKNALVVWEDCQYARALHEALYSAFVTTGQRFASADRIIVHHKIFDQFVSDFHALAKKCKVGYGMTEGKDSPFMGPLINEESLEHYLRHQGIAVREGCEEVMRGKTLDREQKGYYVSPSIHLVNKPDAKSVYQRTEIFGPNVAIYKVTDLDETAEIINLTQYGSVASIYTSARENYLRLIEEISVGHFYWNRPTVETSYRLPYGGIKKSGNARPMGSFAYQQLTYPVSSLESEAEIGYKMPPSFPKLD